MFQNVWAIKFPWAKVVIGVEGKMTQMRCRICNEAEKREKFLVPKFNGLQKHVGHQKTTSACLGVVLVSIRSTKLASMLRMSTNCFSWANFCGSTSCK
jgi:hypothetical protein